MPCDVLSAAMCYLMRTSPRRPAHRRCSDRSSTRKSRQLGGSTGSGAPQLARQELSPSLVGDGLAGGALVDLLPDHEYDKENDEEKDDECDEFPEDTESGYEYGESGWQDNDNNAAEDRNGQYAPMSD